MQSSLKSLRSALLLGVATVVACEGHLALSAESPPAAPATLAEAARSLNLATLPLVAGAEVSGQRRMASLAYGIAGGVKPVFEAQKKQLTDLKWKEAPNSGYVSDQAASTTLQRDGFAVSLSVIPVGKPGMVHVNLIQHGNSKLDKLPLPAGAKSTYAGAASAMFVTAAPVKETAAACRKLLIDQGWQPYGEAGDVQYFKQNAVRLSAFITAAPAQGGKTMITYSSELLSLELPPPPQAIDLRYVDSPGQLFFDTDAPMADVFTFYRKALSKTAWEATLDHAIQIDHKDMVIFRNPAKDMLTLEINEVDGKRRVLLKHQTAAEVAELDARMKAQAERFKAEANKPSPKLAVTLPADAKEVKQTKSEIEFHVPNGKAKADVDAWRAAFIKDGWKEETAVMEDLAGTVLLSKAGLSLTVIYTDTGVLPAEISIRAHGAELERTGGK